MSYDSGLTEEQFNNAKAIVVKPTKLDSIGMLLFGGIASKSVENQPYLSDRLHKAGMTTAPVAYLAGTYFLTILILMVGLIPLILMGPFNALRTPAFIVPMVGLPAIAAVLAYSFRMLQPDLKIKSRGKNIDENLPYAMNFMAAMAGAGVLPVEMFGALGNQEVYGEIRREAHAVYRDCKLVSKDLLQAMRHAAKRSPSKNLEEFFMGAVNTISSGGDLRLFLVNRADYLSQEQRRKQRGFIEGLGVMSESYVVVGAAAPLFLIVVVSIMTLVNSSGQDPNVLLGIIILVGLPFLHGMFGYLMKNLTAD